MRRLRTRAHPGLLTVMQVPRAPHLFGSNAIAARDNVFMIDHLEELVTGSPANP
jgi:hypothetical protein